MTEQQIKDNAPDGATHIDVDSDYWKVVSDDECYFYWGEWIWYVFTLDRALREFELKPL